MTALGRKISVEKAQRWLGDLHPRLWEDERVELLVRTSLMRPAVDLLTATDRRLLAWQTTGGLQGPKLAVTWSEVAELRFEGFGGKLVVRRAAGDTMLFGGVHPEDHRFFHERSRAWLGGDDAVVPSSDEPPAGQEPEVVPHRWLDELERLGALYEKGLLNAAEFRLAKQRLLQP